MTGRNQTILHTQLAMDPIKGIEHRQKFHTGIEENYGVMVRETLVFAKEFVLRLWASDRNRDRFLKHSFWQEKPYRLNVDRLPLLSMQFILGAQKAEGALYEKARNYAKIVEYYLEKNLTATAMLDELKQLTLKEALARCKDEQYEVAVSDKNHPTSDTAASDQLDQIEAPAHALKSSTKVKKQARYPFDPETQVALNIDKVNRDLLLNMAVGKVMLMRLHRVTNHEQWVALEAISVWPPRTR